MLFLIYLIHTHYGEDIYNLNLKCYRLQSWSKEFQFFVSWPAKSTQLKHIFRCLGPTLNQGSRGEWSDLNLNHVSCRLLSFSDRSRLITANYVSWGSQMKLYTLGCLCRNSVIFYSWRSSMLVYYPIRSWYLIQHYSHDWYRIVPQYDSHSFVCAFIVEHH